MTTIRLQRIINYYMASVNELLEEVAKVRDNYVLNENVSYKRTYKQLDRLLRTAWQRLRLCQRIAERINPEFEWRDIMGAERKLKNATEWILF